MTPGMPKIPAKRAFRMVMSKLAPKRFTMMSMKAPITLLVRNFNIRLMLKPMNFAINRMARTPTAKLIMTVEVTVIPPCPSL